LAGSRRPRPRSERRKFCYARRSPDLQAVELTGRDAGPVPIEDARERNLALIAVVADRIAGAGGVGK
jgi:hypothetical protein